MRKIEKIQDTLPNAPIDCPLSEQPTEHASPRLVLTVVPERGDPLLPVVLAGLGALVATAEAGRRVGASPGVTLACSVAALAVVLAQRADRTGER